MAGKQRTSATTATCLHLILSATPRSPRRSRTSYLQQLQRQAPSFIPGDFHLVPKPRGALSSLVPVALDASTPLAAGQVAVRVQATGINFRCGFTPRLFHCCKYFLVWQVNRQKRRMSLQLSAALSGCGVNWNPLLPLLYPTPAGMCSTLWAFTLATPATLAATAPASWPLWVLLLLSLPLTA